MTMPLLLTTVPPADPPELTIRAPLLPVTPTLVLLTIVPVARPPEFTINRPVLLSTVPEATPPLNTSSNAEVPAPLPITCSANVLTNADFPPLPCTVEALSAPPDSTISVPPDWIVLALPVRPAKIVSVWPLLTTTLEALLALLTIPPVLTTVPLSEP